MKQILLLTDFSKTANDAITYARNLWANYECRFHLMHIVNSAGYTTESLIASAPNESLYSSLLKSAKSQLQEALEQLEKQNDNGKHHFKCHLDHDSFLGAVEQMVQKEGIEVVVLGSNGASNVKEVLFGSHALRVMRHLPHNVLVVPEDYSFVPIKRLLLLLHGDDQLTQEHTQRLNRLSRSLKAEIHVLAVDAVSAVNKSILSTVFKDRLQYTEVQDVPLEYAASTLVQAKDINLIVMVGDLEGFTDRLKGYQGKTNLSKLYQSPLFLVRD